MLVNLIIGLVVGGLAGFCAGKLMNSATNSVLINIILGVVGGIVAGLIFGILGCRKYRRKLHSLGSRSLRTYLGVEERAEEVSGLSPIHKLRIEITPLRLRQFAYAKLVSEEFLYSLVSEKDALS